MWKLDPRPCRIGIKKIVKSKWLHSLGPPLQVCGFLKLIYKRSKRKQKKTLAGCWRGATVQGRGGRKIYIRLGPAGYSEVHHKYKCSLSWIFGPEWLAKVFRCLAKTGRKFPELRDFYITENQGVMEVGPCRRSKGDFSISWHHVGGSGKFQVNFCHLVSYIPGLGKTF
jgi:hypothetical protein